MVFRLRRALAAVLAAALFAQTAGAQVVLGAAASSGADGAAAAAIRGTAASPTAAVLPMPPVALGALSAPVAAHASALSAAALPALEAVSGRGLAAAAPVAAIFDVHGTLVESTWRQSYERAYAELTGSADASATADWVERNLVGASEPEVVQRLAAAAGVPAPRAARALTDARAYYKNEHVARELAGAADFLRALRERKVPILVQSEGERNVIVRQLKDAGLLDLLADADILGQDDMARAAPGRVYTPELRDAAIESWARTLPGYRLVHFNNDRTGFGAVRRLGGENVGLIEGAGRAAELSSADLAAHGADFLLHGGWSAWREVLAGLGLSAPAQERAAAAPAPRSNFLTRAATAVALVPAVILAIHAGGLVFAAAVAALTLQSLREYAGMLKAGGKPIETPVVMLAGAALALAPIAGLPLAPLLAAAAGLAVLREVLRPDHSLERAGSTLLGALLFGFLPAHLALLRGLPHGEALTMMAFAAAWATDTIAYAIGKPFGRHKLSPFLSPNKTWEGAVAGAAAAMGVVLGFTALVPGLMSWPLALAAGLVVGVVGQLGGSANSMIKRAMGVKDSGTLLPGHGGVVDRFDAFLFAAPLLYFLLLFLR